MIIKLLIIENVPFDISWIDHGLSAIDFSCKMEIRRTNYDLMQSLLCYRPDIILYGYCPDSIEEALKIRNQIDSSIPFVLFSNPIPEEQSLKLINMGVASIANYPAEIIEKIREAVPKDPPPIKETLLKVVGSMITGKATKTEAVLDTLFENCMEGILLTLTDGAILAANPAACEMLRMTESEIINAGRFGIADSTDPNLERLLKERREKGRAKGEIRLLRKDGSTLLAIISSVVYSEGDGKQRTLMVMRDISESRNTQDQLAQTTSELREALNVINKTFDASMDVICAFDETGRFVQVNAACKTIWGYGREELIGRQWWDFVFPLDLEATHAKEEEIRKGNPVNLFENKIVHKTGVLVPMLWAAKWDEEEKLTYCTAKDISETKRLERAYQIERQRFIDLYNEAPSCMGILKGPNHVYEIANPLYLQLIQKNEDIIGQTVSEVLPELASQGIFEILDEVYKTGKPFIANEMLFQFDFHRNGKLEDIYLNFIYQAHKDSDGNIDGILFFAVNVTEQVLSRRKIEETKTLYKQLIMELPVATYSCDADGKIIIYNKAAAELWCGEPQIGADRWYDLLEICNHEGKQLSIESCPTYIALKEGRTTSGSEVLIQTVGAEPRYVIPHAVPYIDALGNITGAVNMLTDVTESTLAKYALTANEKKYRQIVETAQEGIWLIDGTGTTTFVNQKMCGILDYDENEMIGKPIGDFIEDSNELNRKLAGQMENGYSGQGQFKYVSKSGNTVWLNIAANPIIDNRDVFEGTLIMATDITESKIAEIRVEQQNMKLIKANKELDRFVYSVSHDLRSPMTSISGIISIIEIECQESETLLHIQMIKECVNRLDEFIQKILSYSQNNRSDILIERIALKKKLTDTVRILKNMPQAQGIIFEIYVDEQTAFYSDNLKLITILENLVSNAIKYHKKDGQRFVKLSAISNEDELQLTVSDNGIGIAPAFQDKIFDMFFRISAKSEGSGIGLYIVKDTVEKLHGVISVNSKVKEGTTFQITLKNLQVCA